MRKVLSNTRTKCEVLNCVSNYMLSETWIDKPIVTCLPRCVIVLVDAMPKLGITATKVRHRLDM